MPNTQREKAKSLISVHSQLSYVDEVQHPVASKWCNSVLTLKHECAVVQIYICISSRNRWCVDLCVCAWCCDLWLVLSSRLQAGRLLLIALKLNYNYATYSFALALSFVFPQSLVPLMQYDAQQSAKKAFHDPKAYGKVGYIIPGVSNLFHIHHSVQGTMYLLRSHQPGDWNCW